MSIAKAALIAYYNQEVYPLEYFDYGELDIMHRIVDIAGAKHCSFFTPGQVMACLRNSPYWNKEFYPGFYSGIGNNHACLVIPSERGKKYYNTYLKSKLKNGKYNENIDIH